VTGDGRWRPGARTHYDVLDVPFDAEPELIRRAYRAAAVQLHPDRNAEDQDAATMRMSRLNAAWAVLGDPDQKRAYDRELFGDVDQPDELDGFRFDADDLQSAIHSPRFRVGVAAILLVVLLVIFVFTAYAGAGAPTRP